MYTLNQVFNFKTRIFQVIVPMVALFVNNMAD